MLFSSWNAHLQSHWGKRTWDALFLLAADYPHAQKCSDDVSLTTQEVNLKRAAWRKLFESLPDVLSCPECGRHFAMYMARDKGKPFEKALEDRESLYEWLHKCKDEVNKRTKRKSISLTKVRRKYHAPCDRGKTLRGEHSNLKRRK